MRDDGFEYGPRPKPERDTSGDWENLSLWDKIPDDMKFLGAIIIVFAAGWLLIEGAEQLLDALEELFVSW